MWDIINALLGYNLKRIIVLFLGIKVTINFAKFIVQSPLQIKSNHIEGMEKGGITNTTLLFLIPTELKDQGGALRALPSSFFSAIFFVGEL